MNPEISEKGFVFCTSKKPLNVDAIMIFKEREGITYLLKKEEADKIKLKYNGTWDMITLNVNSDLEAIGFLAKITSVLASEKISVNAASAFYHDHIFVPSEKSEEALKKLKQIMPG